MSSRDESLFHSTLDQPATQHADQTREYAIDGVEDQVADQFNDRLIDQRSPGKGSLSDTVQDLVLDSPDIGVFLKAFSRRAATALSTPGSEIHCAVLLMRPRSRSTMAGSSPEATEMDEIQFKYADGPCLRAAKSQELCVVADFRTEARFGAYSKAILPTGIRSAIGIPIPLDGGAIAALDCYSTRPGEFNAARIQAATRFADEASRALRTAVRIAHLSDTAQNLQNALDSRTTILLAAGIIMGQNRCSHDTAMDVLKSASNGRNTKLHDVAAAVLLSVGQEPPTTHFDN